MRIDIATLFPGICDAFLSESVIGRGRRAGFIEICCHDIRDYSQDKHRRVDDKAYGGGVGMVMRAEPVFACVSELLRINKNANPRLIYMSPQGRLLDQILVKELSREQNLIILCGHYEGVDQRVLDELSFEEISVGDYVVTGGELPALILTDAVARLQPGVLPSPEAYVNDSFFSSRLLEHPLYTRPEIWRARKVPEVLLSGHHANIRAWKEERSKEITELKRPELL